VSSAPIASVSWLDYECTVLILPCLHYTGSSTCWLMALQPIILHGLAVVWHDLAVPLQACFIQALAHSRLLGGCLAACLFPHRLGHPPLVARHCLPALQSTLWLLTAARHTR
jgi:hypothetical protein